MNTLFTPMLALVPMWANVDLAPLLAAVDSSSLGQALVYLVVAAIILGVCWWGLGQIAPPEPWNKVIRVILVLITVLVICEVLLGLIGKPLLFK